MRSGPGNEEQSRKKKIKSLSEARFFLFLLLLLLLYTTSWLNWFWPHEESITRCFMDLICNFLLSSVKCDCCPPLSFSFISRGKKRDPFLLIYCLNQCTSEHTDLVEVDPPRNHLPAAAEEEEVCLHAIFLRLWRCRLNCKTNRNALQSAMNREREEEGEERTKSWWWVDLVLLIDSIK